MQKVTQKKIFTGTLVVLLLSGAWFLQARQSEWNRYRDSMAGLLAEAGKFESGVIQSVPIYDDYRSSAIEGELRTYLLQDHLAVARKTGAQAIKQIAEIRDMEKRGDIVSADASADDLFFFYNVPKENRYLKKFTKEGIHIINERYMKVLASYYPEIGPGTQVKIAISSAVRPAMYQNSLRGKNQNAAFESTHSYGISFDIFYDEYYVSITPGEFAKLSQKEIENSGIARSRRQVGMTTGASLRRQLHTVLSKTLLELQREGKLYAIWESNQRCYHVTILP